MKDDDLQRQDAEDVRGIRGRLHDGCPRIRKPRRIGLQENGVSI